jgi:uncharacterized protein YuzE
MRAEFDPEVRAWYLTLSDAPVSTTVHFSDEVLFDVDDQGGVIGAEFLLAPAEVSEDLRASLFGRFPEVRTALADLGALAVA